MAMAKARIHRPITTLVVLAAIGLPLLVYASYRRDLRSAEVRIATGSQIADTACGPIEYAVAGRGQPV